MENLNIITMHNINQHISQQQYPNISPLPQVTVEINVRMIYYNATIDC
jgi:hypothetical protein